MTQGTKRSVSGAGSPLTCWCYRSLALPGLTLPDILRLTEQAQRGNERLGVTGVLFFSAGHFLQWLEGPAEAVETVMAQILRDGRHSGIEILSQETVTRRRFGEWHMQLSCTEDEAAQLSQGERGEVIVVDPAALPDDGAASNEGIFAVRRFLSDVSDTQGLPQGAGQGTQGNVTSLALRAVPQRVAQRVLLADRAAALTALLLGPNPLGQLDAIEAQFRDHGPAPTDFARLYEAYAEALTERMAQEDGPSIMQVGLAAAALQLVLRRLHHLPDPQKSHGAVTVAAAPGETRFLEATISGEMLRAAGWSTQVLYPQTDDELIERLKQSETRTLVLAASVLDPAHHDAHLERLIARLAADPGLARLRIVVGGRLATRPAQALVAMGVSGWFDHLLDVTAAVVRVACPDGADCGGMRACRQPGAACCAKRINSSFLLANVMPSVAERMVGRKLQSA